MGDSLTIAVSKGRILAEAVPLLARAGVRPLEDPTASRRLIIPTGYDGVRLVIVRAQDVPTYVERGAADVGIAGKDLLLEYQGEGFYEPLDLGISRCRLMVAGRRGTATSAHRLRVATKYVETTRRHFAERGAQVDIIKLYGSMELAPMLGLADRIVDLVDTGRTLRANGLVPLELVAFISARLIVNKASLKMKHSAVKALIARLDAAAAPPPSSARPVPGGRAVAT